MEGCVRLLQTRLLVEDVVHNDNDDKQMLWLNIRTRFRGDNLYGKCKNTHFSGTNEI